jgi:hypothetical protein
MVRSDADADGVVTEKTQQAFDDDSNATPSIALMEAIFCGGGGGSRTAAGLSPVPMQQSHPITIEKSNPRFKR